MGYWTLLDFLRPLDEGDRKSSAGATERLADIQPREIEP